MANRAPNGMTDEDRRALQDAVRRLECLGFGMKAANAIGALIERAIEALPGKGRHLVQEATRRALDACLKAALSSLDKAGARESLDGLHKATCTASGAIGGLFGVSALAFELPVSTTIMLRS